MGQNKEKSSARSLLLVLAAFIWGTAFVAQSMGMDHVGPCLFNAARSFVGSLALLPVAWFTSRRRGGQANLGKAKCWLQNKALLAGGCACGVMLAGGSLLQQMGLTSTTAGKAGFLTSLYIVLVPVLGVFLGRRPGLQVWLGVLVALAGAYCLSGGEGEGFSMAAGDLLVICSAVFFSLHILVIDHFSPQVDGIQLSCVQFFVTGLISLALALVFEGLDWRALLAAWGPLLYTGVLSSGVAYTLQIVGQKGTNPTVASLLMSLESVFAAVSGWVLLGEPLSPRELVGCGLVFTAVILAQLPPRAKGAGAQ